MKIRIFHLCFLLLTTQFLISCGGGGGGGGNGSDRGIRLFNAAIDLPPLELLSRQSDIVQILTRARFGEQVSYAALPSGEQTVSANPLFAGSPVASAIELNYEGNERFIYLIYGDTNALGIRGTLIPVEEHSLESRQSHIRVLHATGLAAEINVTLSNGIQESAAFGTASRGATIPAGPLSFTAQRSVDGLTLTSGALIAEDGAQYTVVIFGEAELFVSAAVIRDI